MYRLRIIAYSCVLLLLYIVPVAFYTVPINVCVCAIAQFNLHARTHIYSKHVNRHLKYMVSQITIWITIMWSLIHVSKDRHNKKTIKYKKNHQSSRKPNITTIIDVKKLFWQFVFGWNGFFAAVESLVFFTSAK